MEFRDLEQAIGFELAFRVFLEMGRVPEDVLQTFTLEEWETVFGIACLGADLEGYVADELVRRTDGFAACRARYESAPIRYDYLRTLLLEKLVTLAVTLPDLVWVRNRAACCLVSDEAPALALQKLAACDCSFAELLELYTHGPAGIKGERVLFQRLMVLAQTFDEWNSLSLPSRAKEATSRAFIISKLAETAQTFEQKLIAYRFMDDRGRSRMEAAWELLAHADTFSRLLELHRYVGQDGHDDDLSAFWTAFLEKLANAASGASDWLQAADAVSYCDKGMHLRPFAMHRLTKAAIGFDDWLQIHDWAVEHEERALAATALGKLEEVGGTIDQLFRILEKRPVPGKAYSLAVRLIGAMVKTPDQAITVCNRESCTVPLYTLCEHLVGEMDGSIEDWKGIFESSVKNSPLRTLAVKKIAELVRA